MASEIGHQGTEMSKPLTQEQAVSFEGAWCCWDHRGGDPFQIKGREFLVTSLSVWKGKVKNRSAAALLKFETGARS